MSHKKFDLNLLPVVSVLLEERSVTKAAEKLGITQSGVSRALNRLRETFDDPLFIKSRLGVEPTAKALHLAAAVRSLLTQVETRLFSSMSFDAATYDGTFSITSTEAAEFWFWPKIFGRLRQLSPRSSYRLLRLSTREIPRELKNGGIDLCVGFFPKLHGTNLMQQGVVSVPPICLLRADHPIHGHKLTIKQFLELEHALVEASGGNILVDHVLGHKRLHRRVVLYTTGYSALPSLIANSDLVAIIPLSLGTHFVASTPNLKLMKPPLEFPCAYVRQYWHRKFHEAPKIKWLRGIIKRIFIDEQKTWRFPAEYPTGVRTLASPRKVVRNGRSRSPADQEFRSGLPGEIEGGDLYQPVRPDEHD